ncbi:MAG: 4-alpha-glucanotransferase [Acidobacteria bacterium]|nr:4-alpha-glucanotransferase [Acidobacteriota bacterium]
MGGRSAGIVLHPTSLPGPRGIGELGPAAVDFLTFLADAGQSVWQVLPLGPTGYGDSPYQCFSAFAGNPLLVSLDRLHEAGLLDDADLRLGEDLPRDEVDFGAVIELKWPLLAKAHAAFESQARPEHREALSGFCTTEASWLSDFALFMALKRANGGAPWYQWAPPLARRDPSALERARAELAPDIRGVEFEQWVFFSQWGELRAEARARGIRIMGDIPIFVSHDSADVWAHPELFHLTEDGQPALQAGVPPDYFSATGQLWGNPLYRWNELARTGYAWWIDRLRAVLSLVDLVRLDHFRGFEAYWEVPGGDSTAENGRWVKGPGAALFAALEGSLGPLPVVVENLGVITPEVEALRRQLGFPGMAVLQFAFGGDDPDSSFLPHNFSRGVVAYTATHDNDTVVGWWRGGVGDSTRSPEDAELEHARALAYVGGDGGEIHWDFLRTLYVSVADTVIVPLQDVLGLGSAARMNLPGRPDGNWRWRFAATDLTPGVRRRLRALTAVSGRLPTLEEPATP